MEKKDMQILVEQYYKFVGIPKRTQNKILNGNLIRINECKNAGLTECFSEKKRVRVYKEKENSCNFIAIYQYSKEKKGMIPDKMFLG